MKINSRQDGFTIVEALLILIVIGIIGFTGWFVWHGKRATYKDLKASGTDQTVASQYKTVDGQKYLLVRDWGVEVPLSGTISSLTSKLESDGTVHFIYAPLRGTSCTVGGDVGVMTRFTASDVDSYSGKKMTALYPDAKIIKNYYYAAVPPDNGCDDAALQAKLDSTRQPLISAIGAVQAQ